MSEFVGVPLKITNDVDLIKPLQALLSARSSSGIDKQDDYKAAVFELNNLRQSATSKGIEKEDSYLEVMIKYHDQLLMLEEKFAPTDITIPFKWRDAFDKGSIFGGKLSLTVTSLTWERFCVLFNIGALQSQIASLQNINQDEGLKKASKLFQHASGIFMHLRSLLPIALGPNEPTPDIQSDSLYALSELMLAQAQEAVTIKAINDKMKPATIAKLASQASGFYSETQKLLQKDTVRNVWERDWIPRVSARLAFYLGVANYYQCAVCNAEKHIGEEIARAQFGLDQLKIAQSRFSVESAPMAERCTTILEKTAKALSDAKRDNDFIYHDRIPNINTLPAIPQVVLAKPTPVQGKIDPNSKDLFEGLAPLAVQHAVQSYESRKSQLVNGEIGKLREANQLLNGVLTSFNLPIALEDLHGDSLPKSLKERNTIVRNAGGRDLIERQLKELPEMLTRNDEILKEAQRLLDEEKASDDELRAQFGNKWIRVPSSVLTERFRNDLAKYKNIIDTARMADGVVRTKYESTKHGIELLSLPESELAAKIPRIGANVKTTGPEVEQLKELMKAVEKIQREREVIENELSSKSVDMKAAFLAAMGDKDRGFDEEKISNRVMQEAYGPIQVRVKENLQQQEIVMAEVEKVAGEWMASRGGGENAREAMMKALASAYDMFNELSKNLAEGAKFYTELTQLLIVFQSKVSDFCFARKTEKDELLKDITTALANPPQEDQQLGAKAERTPPVRPPPPVSSSFGTTPASPPGATQPTVSAQQPQGSPYPESLPYPVQLTGMPQPGYPYSPYGQVPTAQAYPSYTPMPGGYNPYASVSGPTFPGQYLVNRVFDAISHIPVAGPQMKKLYEDSYKQQQNQNRPQ
ncbi:hypothetical protein QYM36_003960 [Artemia franciscana]|uniref:BRO1 domain-containing protein n=1 Tax=Artemia franciscana TaxID=6661 RepID=A0AA88I5L0_ARTSF|nr:hypothetical protein QYM36_003960 [Artemia franciscana]KAK2721820.1 hypothetical protein QYM36_003960 [Artemia franciscana]